MLLDVKKRLPSEMQFQVDGQKYLAASARGDSKAIAAALPYVYYENFDGRGLEALAKIEAVCTINFSGYGLAARYIGANNRLTTVQIKMVPDEEGTGQAWRVVRIERYFPSPGQLTTEQRLEAVEKVKLLYPTTAWTGGVNSSNSNSLVFLEPVETHHRLNAFGKFNNRIESMDAYLAHPLCKAKGVSF